MSVSRFHQLRTEVKQKNLHDEFLVLDDRCPFQSFEIVFFVGCVLINNEKIVFEVCNNKAQVELPHNRHLSLKKKERLKRN